MIMVIVVVNVNGICVFASPLDYFFASPDPTTTGLLRSNFRAVSAGV